MQELDDYKSSTPVLCKAMHNFFTGSPGNKEYKRKLDLLLKEHMNDANKGNISEIIRESIDTCIPDSFLDMKPDDDVVECL